MFGTFAADMSSFYPDTQLHRFCNIIVCKYSLHKKWDREHIWHEVSNMDPSERKKPRCTQVVSGVARILLKDRMVGEKANCFFHWITDNNIWDKLLFCCLLTNFYWFYLFYTIIHTYIIYMYICMCVCVHVYLPHPQAHGHVLLQNAVTFPVLKLTSCTCTT